MRGESRGGNNKKAKGKGGVWADVWGTQWRQFRTARWISLKTTGEQ